MRLARTIRLLLCALPTTTGILSAQEPVVPGRVEVAYTESPVAIDGDAREWAAVVPLRLERRSQLISTGRIDWRGPQDASALVRLLYDESHLYVCAQLSDADPMVQQPNETWESGDVLELFFDTDLRDGQQGETEWNQDDLQLMLLPHARDRTWAAIDPGAHDAVGRRTSKGVDRGFTGIRVARAAIEGGVLIETAIPLHNLPRLQPGTREIGFNVAFGDKDPGRDVYHYLVWTGSEPPANSPSNFGRLVFAGPPVLSPVRESGAPWTRALFGWLPFLLPALLVLALLLIARRVYRGPLARVPRVQRAVGAGAGILCLFALLLPDVATRLREHRQRQRGEEIAGWMAEKLPVMEQGSLGTLKGASRDVPLIDLLTGGFLRRPVEYEFSALAEISPSDLGYRALDLPHAGLSIYPYRIPLGTTPLQFQVWHPAAGDTLYFVMTRASELRMDFVGPRLLVTLEGLGEERPIVVPLEEMLEEWGAAPERNGLVGRLELQHEVRTLRIESLDGSELRLEGISRLPRAGGATGQPVFLGSVSRLGVGVPTMLIGPHPRDAVRILAPGTNWRLSLPSPIEGVERVWLLLEALDSPEFGATPDSAVVAQVVFGPEAEGERRQVFDLRHQMEIFATIKDANPELQRLGEPGYAQIAYEWEERGQETRITPGIPLSFGAARSVRGFTLVNNGAYPLRVRSVVFARPKVVDASEPAESPLVSTGRSGEVRLDPPSLARVRAGTFLLFRDGLLSVASDRRAAQSLKLPAEAASLLQSGSRAHARELLLPGSGSHEVYLPLRGEGWGNAVLAVVLQDPERAAFTQRLRIIGLIVGGIGLPLFLVFLLETLVSLGGLRLQLTGTVVFATVAPLAMLSIFLVNLLETGQREKDRNRLLSDLQLAQERLEEARSLMVEEAREGARRLGDALRTSLAEAPDAQGKREGRVRQALTEALTLARPKGWSDDSFLAVEVPHPDEAGRVLRVLDRESSRKLGETPLGPDSGVYLRWGRVFIGARADLEFEPGRNLRLSRGRVLDATWLGTLVPRGMLALYDLKGYPLAVGSAGVAPEVHADFVRAHSRAAAMAEKVPLIDRLRESPGPQVAEIGEGDDLRRGAFTLLSDRGGTPIALFSSVDHPTEATLPLFFGNVPVRPFFIAVGGLLLVLVTFLTLTLTDRISGPIERLEGLARRLSRGDLEVEVDPVPGGNEVANLNRAFGVMAAELRERIVQQEQMNRAIARLANALSIEAVAAEAVQILREAGGADRVALLLHDRETRRLQAFDEEGAPRDVSWQAPITGLVFHSEGPFNLALPQSELEGYLPWMAAKGSCVVFPLRAHERRWGAILLQFVGRQPPELDFAYVQGLLQQVVSAMETARLYRLAIEDATTRLFVQRYFRRRVMQEVDRAQRTSDRVAVIRLEIRGRLREELGDAHFDLLLGRLGAELSHELPPNALAGRVGLVSFEFLLPNAGGVEGRKLAARLRGVASAVLLDMGRGARYQLVAAAVSFPDDGSSSAFLQTALDQRLRAGSTEPASPTVPVRRGGAVFVATRMLDLLGTVERAAVTDLTLLIEGETGVGKEVFVDICHAASPRSQGPLVKVNCAAIPASLMESELFGHEKGAFTGALDRKRGYFEQAEGGTLFLDEIGEMPVEVQAKLLRVLQGNEVLRVGGERPILVNVRLIAATQRDLRSMIREGTFREDLYYRLQGLRLLVPPLRDRKEEIPALVDLFREQFGSEARHPSAAALDAMYQYHWPGNVRELENVLKRALVLAGGRYLEPEDLDLGPPADRALIRTVAGSTPPDRGSVRAAGPPVADATAPASTPPSEIQDPEARWDAVLAYFARVDPERGAGLAPRVYRELVGVSRRTATRDLAGWLAEGRLTSRGQKRSVRYFLAVRSGHAAAGG